MEPTVAVLRRSTLAVLLNPEMEFAAPTLATMKEFTAARTEERAIRDTIAVELSAATPDIAATRTFNASLQDRDQQSLLESSSPLDSLSSLSSSSSVAEPEPELDECDKDKLRW